MRNFFTHLPGFLSRGTALLIMIMLPLLGRGQLATYAISGLSGSTATTLSATGVNANVTAADLTKVVVVSTSSSAKFRASGWPITPATRDVTKYIGFTMTPNSGITMNLTSLKYGVSSSGTGPTTYQWYSSLDNYTTAITTVTAPIAAGTTLALPTTFAALTAAVSFRVYGYGGSATAGTGGLDGDLVVLGTAAAATVPVLNPSPTALSGLGYAFGAATSPEQSFTVSGTNLTGAPGSITVSVPTTSKYEITTTSGSGYTNSVAVAYSSATPTALGPVYVRLKLGQTSGNYAETVSLSGGGGTGSVSLTGAVAVGMTEVYVPQYALASGSADGRVPYAFRLTLSGLTASATYRYLTQAIKTTDALVSANIKGNSIFAIQSGVFVRAGTPSLSTAGSYDSFVASASGTYTGWFVLETTNSATTFPSGASIYPVVQLNDGTSTGTTVASIVPTTSAVTLLTYGATTSGATAVSGFSSATASNFVLSYDNTAGTGRPLYASLVESDGVAETTANIYASFYSTTVNGVAGAYGLLTPSTNANGIQRIEQRALADGSLVCANTNANGRWPSGVITVNPTATTTAATTALVIAATDAPLATATVTTTVSPATGPISTSVTIAGTNFMSGTTVLFNGTTATPSAISATSITVAVPTGATTGAVTVNTPSATSSCSAVVAAGTFTVSAAAPSILATPTALSAFTTPRGTPSTVQTYTVSGSNLSGTTGITVAAPTGFEIGQGTTPASYSAGFTIAQTSTGTVATTTVSVRLAGTTAGIYGTSTTPVSVTNVSGATSQSVSVYGTVTDVPSVSTTANSAVTNNTATSGGNVTSDGNSPITARGVVYGTSPSPRISGTGVTNLTATGTTGVFTSSLTGLTGNTTYYAAAYATNSMGTTYGADDSFTTLMTPLLNYSFTTANAAGVAGDPNISGTAFTASSDLSLTNGYSTPDFRRSNFPLTSTLTDNTLGYYQFTLTVTAGYQANLSYLTLLDRRSNTGAATYELRTSLDGFASTVGAVQTTTNGSFGAKTITLTGATGLSSVTGTLTVRIYAYAATGTSGTFAVNSVNLYGIVGTPAGLLTLEDDYNYTAATSLVGQSGWAQTGTTTATSPIQVVAGPTATASMQAQYPNGAALNNNQAQLQTGTTNGQNANKTFALPAGATTFYASAVLNLSSATATPAYFLHLLDNTQTGTNSLFRGKVFSQTSGAGFVLGITNNATATTTNFTTTVYGFNKPYLVVLKCVINPGASDDTYSLFVFDGAASLTEPATPSVGPTTDVATDGTLNAVGLRQDNAGPTATIDGLRVATGWGVVVGQPVYNVVGAVINAGNYFNVTINNADVLTSAGAVNVEGALGLSSGKITTTTTNSFTLYPAATVTGGSAASYVNGPLARGISTTGTATAFPIGSSIAYRPLALSVTTQTAAATYVASVTEQSSRSRGLASGTALTRVSGFRFFSVNEKGTTNFRSGTLKLPFASGDGVTNLTTLRLASSTLTAPPYADVDPTGTPTTTGVASSGTIMDVTSVLGDFALATTSTDFATNPLPVVLRAFSVQRLANPSVAVTWTTASEKNSAFFEVQRSLTGFEFATVARVAAQGTTSQAVTYTAADNKAPAGRLYYRLRQTDTDGTATYSPVAVVASLPTSVELYPNPAHTGISFLATPATPYRILNQLGQALLQGTTEASTSTVAIDKLAPGLYVLELQTAAGRTMQKFEKQ